MSAETRSSLAKAIGSSSRLSLAGMSPRLCQTAAQIDAIVRYGQDIDFRILDLELRLSFQPEPAAQQASLVVGILLDGVPIEIYLEDFFIVKSLQKFLPGVQIDTVPQTLKAALLELALEEVSEAIRQRCGCDLAVVFLRESPGESAGDAGLGFALTQLQGNDQIHGWINAEPRNLFLIAELLYRHRRRLTTARRDTPAPIRLEIGTTHLTRDELAQLEPGDIVSLDRSFLRHGGVGVMRALGDVTFPVRISLREESATVTMIAPPSEEPEWHRPPSRIASARFSREGSLGDVGPAAEVELSFEVELLQLMPSEIEGLEPGRSFNLDKSRRFSAEILSDGHPIGTGELWRVDGRVAICISAIDRDSPP